MSNVFAVLPGTSSGLQEQGARLEKGKEGWKWMEELLSADLSLHGMSFPSFTEGESST